MIPKLYDHQQKQKNENYEAIQKGHKSILNTLATGGGKTIIFGDITRDFTKQHKLTWILTHREEIRLQTIEKLYNFGINPGQIASGRPLTTNRVQVASVQTLVNMIDNMKYFGVKPDLIHIDECHHATAPTWLKIINAFPEAINMGWTATPVRMDDKGLGHIYKKMIQGKQSKWLVENGCLTEPVVFSSPAALEIAKQKFKIKNNEFDLAQQTVFLGQKRIVQDTVNCYRKFFNGAPAIIFCASSEDMKVVHKAMSSDGWSGGIIKSGMDSDLRRDYITGLATGKYNYMCSYDVIGEGVDIPVLAGIIIRRLTKSLTNYLQWCGRPLRLANGKKYGIIVDQAGNYYLHGHPLIDRVWSLDGKPLKSSENEIKSRECPNPQCRAFITDNPAECPYCGVDLTKKQSAPRRKELKVVNAELLEVKCPVLAPQNKQGIKTPTALLNNIVDNTMKSIDKQDNNIETRFNFLMDNLNKSPVNTAWEKYGI